MTSYQPRPVRIARWAAGAQTAFLATLACLALGFAAVAHHSDLATERAGHPNDYAGLGTAVGIFCAILAVACLLAVAIPLLLWRRGRPAARIVLIVVEAISLVPFAPRIPGC